LAQRTDPADKHSLTEAVASFNQIENSYALREEFFQALRAKVAFPARGQYVENVASSSTSFSTESFESSRNARGNGEVHQRH
jgi:hypothetical protein